MTAKTIPSPEGTPAIAASLARYGIRVFPVRLTLTDEGKRTKTPLVSSFPTDASDDPGSVFEWWQKHPTAFVGIAVGPSGIIGLDLDLEHLHDGELYNGVKELKARGLKPPKTLSYHTLGGGRHYLYRAPEGANPTNAQDLEVDGQRIEGVDVRGGNGFMVYYGDELTAEPTIAPAPKWVVLEKKYEASHDLRLDAWLKSLEPGKPTVKATAILDEMSTSGMSHDDLLRTTKKLAELGAAGKPGIRKVIDKARAIYSDGWPGYEEHFDAALIGSANFWGMPVETINAGKPRSRDQKPKGKTKKSKTKGKSKKKGKGGALVRQPLTANLPAGIPEIKIKKAVRSHPDDFFEKATGLQAKLLADVVNRRDLAIGDDKLFWKYEHGVWVPKDEAVRDRVVGILGNRYRRDFTPLMRDIIAADVETPRLGNEPQSDYMNLTNGMYHWSTGELLPHAPGFFSTVRLPVALDVEAECPVFDEWLDEVTGGDDELETVIMELIAYTMLSGNPFQKAALLVGPGGTGKGTLLRLLIRMIGANNISSLTPAAMAETFPPAQMLGKLANVNGDLDGSYLPDSAAFKSVTGGDIIEAQHKNAPLFRYRPWCFPIFATNAIAKTGDTSSGYFRRWVVVPFDHQVDRGKPYDESAIHAEADGIFRKAMTYLPTIIAQNGFTEGVALMKARAEFELESDVVREWLSDDEHVVTADPSDAHAHTDRAFLYGRYVEWTKDTGHGRALSRSKLGKRLAALGFDEYKSSGARTIRGIALDSKPAPEAGARPSPHGTGYYPSDALDP